MLRIHSSNRYRVLVELLCDRLDAERGDVFTADEVVVPSLAVRRSLTLAVAERDGICANVQFDFLAHWLWRQVGRLVPALRGESPFATQALSWRLFAALADAQLLEPHPRLARYLSGADEVMRYELAARVGALFEQYATYRPEWLAAWQAGRAPAGDDGDKAPDQPWQAALWRRVVAELPAGMRDPIPDIAHALRHLDRAMATKAGLPASVHLFALPTMAPLHLGWLGALGAAIDIDLYLLNPCREYWYEVVDSKRLAALRSRGTAAAHETGNRLLAGWGRQTQSHLGLIAASAAIAEEDDRFVVRDERTLLGALQNAILDLRELGPGEHALAATDRSLEVHLCHSLTRELEVLQDHLLGLFAAPGSTLRPADILVVTPDLERAAALVDAVFGTVPADRFIPYAVSGRARTQVNAPAQALFAVLALLGSRFKASAVLGLLQQPIVARAWALDDEALARIADWLRASGTHWGLDAEHRGSFDVPATARHTLADGLDRLFLGYAMPDQLDEPFADLLPAGSAEGTSAGVLGVLWRCLDELRTLQAATAQPRPGAAWSSFLLDVLAAFTRPVGDESEDARELQLVVRQLGVDMQAAGDAAVSLAVVGAALRRAVDDPTRGGVAGGGVTFSSMASLRNLPFAVVCAIGMNDGAFPSGRPPPEIDLMALRPRPGDRQRRDDERNLFLDLLLAAESSLYLSYVGRSARDNASLPPSVLVDELLDVVVAAVAPAAASPAALAAARARLVVEHPLQPFASEAFTVGGEPRLRSFDRELAAALQQSLGSDAARVDAARPVARAVALEDDEGDELEAEATAADDIGSAWSAGLFFAAPLPPPSAEWHTVTLAQLTDFFCQPSRHLLRRRLGIELPRAAEPGDDDEPFLPDRLSGYAVGDRLLEPALAGAAGSGLRRLAEADTKLPQGAFGAQYLDAELATLRAFTDRVRAATGELPLPPLRQTIEIALGAEPWQLDAAFADLRPSGLVRWRYDVLLGRHAIAAWLSHLALCAIAPAGVQQQTRWLSRNVTVDLAPVVDAQPLLESLLTMYRDGLQAPLRFFPKSAWEAWKSGAEDRRAAGVKWRVSRSTPFAEGADPAYRLALRGAGDALDAAFFANARSFFEPMLAHATFESVGG